MKRVFSGVQPTGNLHLGNYLGAIRNFVSLQKTHECIYCVVDMHAITVKQDPEVLKNNILEVAAAFIASGIDPTKSIIFAQSQVSAHAELSWIFNCTARLGWLNRMTQFKEKAGKNRENASAGLYVYPVLMAADILAYHATHVPVGEDQKQHLELARDIAQKFNNDFDIDFFPITEPLILGAATRVMSLRDGTKKMSKSDLSDYSRINLTDNADDIAAKIKKAKTDPLSLPEIDSIDEGGNFKENIISERPEMVNLINIYSALSNSSILEVVTKYSGTQFSLFKNDLRDLSVDALGSITNEMRKLLDDKKYLEDILINGGSKANDIAEPIIKKTKNIVGFF
ncbi:MAG: tryptophan--tRNA ligase [Rickettsiales bacterium]|nr:tryptophan--tRNA ligase [Rickettsiales bacterium]MBT35375.1 tryptophan--tRNA ligase [Rickettsiales bacterium]|tara:strand:+ start:2661 stop:3683 length:1023 start_codon:yes stop_codon:yes gene_type:complete